MEGARFSPRKKSSARRYCWVNGCHSQSQKDLDLRFHSIPRDGKRLVYRKDIFGNVTSSDKAEAWRSALKMKNTNKNVQVCSLHFKKTDYILPDCTSQKRYLKASAVPSCNLPGVLQSNGTCGSSHSDRLQRHLKRNEKNVDPVIMVDAEETLEEKNEDRKGNKDSNVSENKMPAPPSLIQICSFIDASELVPRTSNFSPILTEAYNIEFHDGTLQTVMKIKTEKSEMDYLKIEKKESDVNNEYRSEELGSERCLVTSEPDIESQGRNIGIKLEKIELLDCETKVHVKSEFDGIELKDEELIIKQEDEINPNIFPLPDKLFRCTKCSYQAKGKEKLEEHLSVHEDQTRVQLFNCDKCNGQFKQKGNLNQHMLVHKDPSQIFMYKCDKCSFESKYKIGLSQHLLVHKDPSQIKMSKCNKCTFETKYKCSLKQHMLLHLCPSEVRMSKCNECSYESKHKNNLKRHILLHKNPSQVQMFKCNECSRQFYREAGLKIHMWVHKNPDVQM